MTQSQLQASSRCERRARRFNRERQIRAQRERKDYNHFLADILQTGLIGDAANDPGLASLLPRCGGAEGYSAVGMPIAAGGVDVSAALTSVRPGIRKIKRRIASVQLVENQTEITIPLPRSGYLEKPRIRFEGTFKFVQGSVERKLTANDLRTLVQRIRIELSSTVVPKSLSGLQCDIIDNLDVAAVATNASKGPTGAEATKAANSTTEVNFVLEFTPRLTISDANLYGIPYLGAIGTTPQIFIQLNPILGAVGSAPFTPEEGANGPTATLVKTKVVVDGWRVDLPAPVAPSSTTDSEGHTIQIPGEGLWAESGYVLKTAPVDTQERVSAEMEKKFQIPIGPMYTRLLLLAYVGNVLDTEVVGGKTGIVDHTELGVQEATIIEARYPSDYDADYRTSYYKTRPTGVYVNSGIDQSGTDEDLWVTQDLGNFEFTVFTTSRADGAVGTKYELLAQSLAPVSKPGLYL